MRRSIPSLGYLLLLFYSSGCERSSVPGNPSAATKAATAGSTTQPVSSVEASSCQREAVKKPDALTIAVIPMGSTHEFWKAIHAGAVKAEQELKGVQIIWKGPIREDDREGQISVLENFINHGVSGIALAPLDNVALIRPVRDAIRAGIGVVVMDGDLDAVACTDFASQIATNSYQGGCLGARRLGEILNGKGSAFLLRCAVGFVGTTRREKGFLDTMAREFSGIRIVSSDQYGGATVESAQNKGESLLQRFPDVDGIFCPNESTTFGMLRAVQGTGRAGKVKLVGFDSSDKLVAALAAGQINGLVLQDPLNIGYTAVRTLTAYLRGEQVPTRIDTGCTVATPESMNQPRIRELLSPPIDRYLR